MLALLATLIACAYVYLRSFFNYWKDRGIPGFGATDFFKNNLDLLLARRTFYEVQVDMYNSLNGHKYGGSFDFAKPSLMVRDPDLVERILIKDFNHFMDRAVQPIREDDILTLNLVNAQGDRWRTLRNKLTPTFTSGKLKGMFEQIDRCCDDLIRFIGEEGANGDKQLDGKPLMNRYAMNVIATCAFGIEFSYHDEERDKFLAMVKKLTMPSFKTTLRFLAQVFCPGLMRFLRVKSLDTKTTNYFVGLVEEAFRCRTENNTRRNDFLQLLLDLKKNEEKGVSIRAEEVADCEPEDAVINQMHHVSEQEHKAMEQNKWFTLQSITAQAIIFLTAGAETATGLMNFFLFTVATHSDIQNKLQKEVDQVLHKHCQWNYQMLKDMTYTDQVIQETMRMYPAATLLIRTCTKPYQLPDRDFVIEPGTFVIVPVYALHYDPQYYPDPQKFDPDRFIDTNYKPNGYYLPFGDGPRICIAMRFALLEMKICLARMIAEYNITLGSNTKMPLQFEPRGFSLVPKDGIWLKFEKRKHHKN